MFADEFTQRIDQLYSRLNRLFVQSRESPDLSSGSLLEEVVEDLKISLEELRVAQDEMNQQHQELAAASEALAAERQKYLELFEFAPDGYLVTDGYGKILAANHAAGQLFDYQPRVLVGKILAARVAEPDRHTFRQRLVRFQRLAETASEGVSQSKFHDRPKPEEWEFRMQSRENIPFDALLKVAVIQDADGLQLRWLIRDVTAQKQTERGLQESELIFRSLAETAAVAVLIVQNGRIQYANPALSVVTGYKLEELLGKEFLELVSPDHRDALSLNRIVLPSNPGVSRPTGLEVQRWELKLENRTGQECWVDLAAGYVRLKGRSSWVISAYDITSRVQAEQGRTELLRRLVTAQEDERSRIARELHDQLGQSLSAMIIGLKSLEETASTEMAGRIRRLRQQTDELSRSTHRMARELHPAALEDLGLQAALRNYAEEWALLHGVQVDCQMELPLEKRLPRTIATTVYRIVQEALVNVARHAQAGKVSLILGERQGNLIAIVEDDGQGFPASESMIPAAGRGRLGLLGMKERAELAGGILQVESAPGQGATVFVRIPLSSNGRSE
jgi:PAS domain S-box-containing protein